MVLLSSLMRFQSHAGSIEAWNSGTTPGGDDEEFQSHAGSIEAASESESAPESLWGFNPTLVRLRPAL